ncbi:hypothetical protein A2738_03200 [Candidatus Nomurabacteria bacterium RIFCSPHIGHO2_01_FULL_42_15]|uniref:TrbC/VIRB2 family protein n=1 Tax=Candidatus Nomurabacteria bacterium RIFCSPHIGHO2_01_FULL_42_15 TaxID=1801742 RepID=A0A1F6VDY0_9BACT|nr:MAG: hypothetical protein A2738_03200 [Candidatus Nomurabacteria bacterium RIFCSPHIGHO2_01_FULL_42_15]OGI92937.1 MAG: hypothetical protein A3A99_00115 [Candidatus Nomurabacteria bacterium RIFCSPLOWO2_01_FULL_41_18]
MQKIKKLIIPNLIFVIVFMMLVAPVFSFAQTAIDTDKPDRSFAEGKSLVPCGNDRTPIVKDANGKETGGDIVNPCSFKDAMTLINTVIRFIFIYLAVPIAAIMFFYAGFKMVTSGGSTEARGTAKKVFTNAVLGLVIAAGAWLIIRTLLSILGYKDIGTFF